MRDDLIRARLVESNPWWQAAASGVEPQAWADADPVLRARRPFDLGYRSAILADVAHGPVDDKLVIVRGPRRVGKSVLLKDTIAALCGRSDIDPRQAIYLATDTMRATDLHRVVVLGRDLTRSIDPAPRIWLFDEITAVRDWTATIKYLRDNTALSEDTVICTGSSWDHAAEVERDLLAGRAGRSSTHRLRVLLPMTFREVIAVTGRAIPAPPPVAPWELQNDNVAAALDQAEFFTEPLDLAWQNYLTSGGFPRAVGEHHRDGLVSDAFVGDLIAWLHRDVDPDAPADSVALLLAELTRRSTSPLNRTDAAQALGYPNRQSFDRRLARLVDSCAALWCHQIDDTGSRVAGSQSKLYLSDPLLAWLGSRSRAGLPSPDFTQLTENAIGAAMARAIDGLQPGRWRSEDTIGYLRTTSGKEVDLAPVPVPTAAGRALTSPLECKWVTKGWRGKSKVIESRYNRGIVATRNVIDHNHAVWAAPAPIVALLLG
jgi:uncharacterized protein